MGYSLAGYVIHTPPRSSSVVTDETERVKIAVILYVFSRNSLLLRIYANRTNIVFEIRLQVAYFEEIVPLKNIYNKLNTVLLVRNSNNHAINDAEIRGTTDKLVPYIMRGH